MTESDFTKTFRQVSAEHLPASPDAHQMMLELVRGDQRRTRLLAAVSLFFWLIGTAGMLLLVYALNRLVIFIRVSDAFASIRASAPSAQSVPPELRQMLWGTTLLHHSLPWIGVSVVALMLAAVLTVALVFSSRRATLGRISISLIQISEQLKQIRGAAPGEIP